MNTQLDQEILIDRCLKGDRTAQYELYQAYSKAMFNVALRIMGDRTEAEDVLQTSFIRVFKNLEYFRGESTLGAWIKRIVVNHSLTEIKKRRIYFEEVEDDVIPVSIELEDEKIDQQVRLIRKAMTLLPPGYRTIFSLYLMEGYDHQEISEMMDISVATSKSQLSRAKKKIRELINALS